MAEPQAPRNPIRREPTVAVLTPEVESPAPNISLVQKDTSVIMDLGNLVDRRARARGIDAAWRGDPEYDLTRVEQAKLIFDLLGKLKDGTLTEAEFIEVLAPEETEQIVANGRDELTQLHRRERWKPSMETAIGINRRSGAPTAVLFVDIDGLKPANDKHGHETGNAVLTTAAKVIQASIRKMDIAVRYGGDEDIVGLPGAGADIAIKKAERIRAGIQSKEDSEMRRQGVMLDKPITASIGVFVADPEIEINPENQTPVDVTLAEATEAADTAMYVAKSLNGNRVIYAFKTKEGIMHYQDMSLNGKTYKVTRDEKRKIAKIEPIAE